MHNQVLLSAALAGLATTVGATYNHAAANQLRDLSSEPAHAVPRQAAESGSRACTTSVVSLIQGLPTPTGELLDYYASQTTALPADYTGTSLPSGFLGSACAAVQTQSVPASLSAPLSSYEASLLGWYGSHTQDIEALFSSCSADPLMASASSLLAEVTKEPACSSLLGGAGSGSGSGSPSATATASGADKSGGQGGSPTASSTTTHTAAAAKPTAMVAGIVAAAGFIGAVAMM